MRWAETVLTAARSAGAWPSACRQAVSQRRKHRGLLTIPNDMGSGKRFALQVKGDSMTGAGILDGDRVIVKQQGAAENGEIVCAVINGEATLKRF